ncbi:hypothetical protein D3C86_1668980 [compost metagenome]
MGQQGFGYRVEAEVKLQPRHVREPVHRGGGHQCRRLQAAHATAGHHQAKHGQQHAGNPEEQGDRQLGFKAEHHIGDHRREQGSADQAGQYRQGWRINQQGLVKQHGFEAFAKDYQEGQAEQGCPA